MYTGNPEWEHHISLTNSGNGMDYVRYKINGAEITNVIAAPAASTLAACEFACSTSQNCEGVMFTAWKSSCAMVASVLDGENSIGAVHVWP